MIELTPFRLTPLGLFHTLISIVGVGLAFVALYRDHAITPRTTIGRIYLGFVLATTVTGLPIFRQGTITPPHVVGILTLLAFAVAAVARHTGAFGRAAAYVETACYSATVLFMLIPTVTETLTRVPPGAPWVAGPEAPILQLLNGILIVLFVAGVTWQVRVIRAARAGRPEAA